MIKKTKKNYINNAEFLEAVKAYKKLCLEAEDAGDEVPRIPNYIGECIFKIATRLASRPNFSGYTYKDDMISDGLENAIQALGNFDPEKSHNPFAYFTQITYYSFIRRIKKEARQTETKLNYLASIDLQQLLDEIEGDSGNYEYLKWVQEQIDSNAKDKKEISKVSETAQPKRRPKYFDEKEESVLDI